MIVSELIKHLQGMPQDVKVYYTDDGLQREVYSVSYDEFVNKNGLVTLREVEIG
jgi:hypothetical protein